MSLVKFFKCMLHAPVAKILPCPMSILTNTPVECHLSFRDWSLITGSGGGGATK